MPSRVLLRCYVVALAMSAVCLPTAQADSFNWIGLGNTPNWDDHPGLYANWGTIALPTATSDVNFGNFLSSGNPNLHGNRAVNSVAVSTSGDFTLTGGVGDTLTLASGNFTQQSGAASAGTHQVNVPVVIQQDGVWNIAGAGVTFSGGVNPSFAAGIHMLTKTGAGPLTLSGGDALFSLIDVKTGSFTLDGASVSLYGLGPDNIGGATVGDGSSAASVLLQNGALLSMVGLVGMDIGGITNNPASVTLAGANTSWQGAGSVNIGLGGPGQLLIKDSATASLGFIYIGNSTTGVLTVQAGGTLHNSAADIGDGTSSVGTATVTGTGSQWAVTNLSVGGIDGFPGGNGTLNVTAGGAVTATSIEMFSGANVTVDQGQLSTTFLSSIGNGGTINLLNDTFGVPAFTVGYQFGDSTYGGVISGGGTLYKSGGSTLTLTGQNTLTGKTVIAGGQVILGNSEALQSSVVDFETKNGLNLNGLIAVFLGSITGSSDQDFGSTSIYLDGSSTDQTYSGNISGIATLTKYGTKRLILTGTKNFMAFTEVDQGSLLVNGKLQGVGVTVNSDGTLAGTGQVAANILVNSGGAIAPGTGPASNDAAGILNVQSAYFESGSELDITLHGTTRGTKYGALIASNDVILGGKLRVTLFGFMPGAGQTFDILDWGTVSGSFTGIILPTLQSSLMWNKSKLYTDGILSIALAGDYNGNGVVDEADYVLWRDTLGETGIALAADGNNNGTVDSGDFDIWRSNFGRQIFSAAAGSVTSIPEPSTNILVSIGLPLLLCYVGTRLS